MQKKGISAPPPCPLLFSYRRFRVGHDRESVRPPYTALRRCGTFRLYFFFLLQLHRPRAYT
jgi:hypothetical protein